MTELPAPAQSPNLSPSPSRSLTHSVKLFFERHPWLPRLLWQGKVLPAFWTVASLLSLTVNIVLIITLILVGRQLFALKTLVEKQLIGGLAYNFQLMDQAHIRTTIPISQTIQVKDTMPVVFDLPLAQDTTVVLTKDTEIPNTWVALDTMGQGINLSINTAADITLPEGTPLDIRLQMIVPVSQTIAVNLNVPVVMSVDVDIPLNQTELHKPFSGLQGVVAPYQGFMSTLPNAWDETPLCSGKLDWACKFLFGLK